MKASYSSIATLKSGSTPSEAAGFSVGLLLSLSSLPDCSVLSEVRGFSVRTVSVCALFDDPEGSESFWDFDTHKTITQTTTAAAMTSTARNLKNPLKNSTHYYSPFSDSSAAPAKFAAALPSTMCSFFIFALSASVSIEPNISAAIPMNANQHAQPSL